MRTLRKVLQAIEKVVTEFFMTLFFGGRERYTFIPSSSWRLLARDPAMVRCGIHTTTAEGVVVDDRAAALLGIQPGSADRTWLESYIADWCNRGR